MGITMTNCWRQRELNRRRFLSAGFQGFSAFLGASLLHGCSRSGSTAAVPPPPPPPGPGSNIRNLGPLQAPDQNGVRLPVGFTSRVVARSGQQPTGSGYTWHDAPDGGATFQVPGGGWVYVSNSELDGGAGGVGALGFDQDASVIMAYQILSGTSLNCAGGRTPWNTWLSCEEVGTGRVWECDPYGISPPVQRPSLGSFQHEAVAVDPVHGQLFLTEDQSDGRLYRFVPAAWPDLSTGTLQVAQVTSGGLEGPVVWHDVPDPLGGTASPTRHQVPASTAFNGGEGVAYNAGIVYFSTKGDNRIWCLDTATQEFTILYDAGTSPTPILTGVDNVEITPDGDVLVAEDGGDLQIVAITPSGIILPILQLVGHDSSEITGPAFDPSRTRLYFSSQRGTTGSSSGGMTFEVTGPFVV